jgi:membrane protease subunit HflC
MQRVPLALGLTLVVLLAIGSQCLFVVHQTEKALVLQLGEPLDKIYMPGLHFKLPFVQNVEYFNARILDYEAPPAEALTVDKKAIVLSNYARWTIENPLQFYRTMRTIPGAQARLKDVVYSQLRILVGSYTLVEVVSSQRAAIMETVTNRVDELMKGFGVKVVDVRIKRTDLPPENSRAIYGRMRTERERMAKQYRSEGEEESTRIRSDADRQRAVELAEAGRKSELIRGEGDAEAARIYAETFGKAPDFFEFQRGLEALRKSLKQNTRVVITQDNPFFKSIRE